LKAGQGQGIGLDAETPKERKIEESKKKRGVFWRLTSTEDRQLLTAGFKRKNSQQEG